MDEQERQKQAQEFLEAALHTLAQNLGMSIEPILQVEGVSQAYATSRAVLIIKSIPGWQPPVETKTK